MSEEHPSDRRVQSWLPVIVLLVTLSGQWLVVFFKMMDMQVSITRVSTLVESHLKQTKHSLAEKIGDTRGRVVLGKLKYGDPEQ